MFKINGCGVRMSRGSLLDSLAYNSNTYNDMEGIPKETYMTISQFISTQVAALNKSK